MAMFDQHLPKMRRYIANVLPRFFTVVETVDGQAALDQVKRDKPDLILADISMCCCCSQFRSLPLGNCSAVMPGLDGFGLLQALRSVPDTKSIPIIFLSARAGPDARVDGLLAGADD